ncbi:unnamed protein product [Heterobilharzia americana]|nr:unnamed protein product [Heterobilharzia americana]
MQAFPGSPPIKTLRHHRTSLTKNESTQQSISSSRSVDAALSSGHRSLLQSPPKRPPKPRHLCLSSPTTLEAVELKPVASKISVEKKFDDETSESLKISTTDNQPSAEKVNGDLPHSNTAQHSAVSSSHISAIEIKPHQVINDDPVERLSYASITPFYSFKKSAQPTENGLTNNDVCQESCDAIQSAENPHLQSTKRSLNLPIDHHCASANSPEIQDFVLPPDAFHTAPFHGTACETASNDLPVLQHAETVAVDTPDDEDVVDDKINDCVEHHTANSSIIIINGSQCTSPFSPLTTLPIPKGLNVVAVDADGVHIFEDGNFLYALPGLNDKCSDDSDFYDSREDVVNISDLIPSYTVTEQQVNEENDKKINLDKFVSISSSSNPSKPQTSGKLVNKCTGSNDSLVRQPRVRFSSEPILVFSTHSTTDYNRRNEEIDPLSASAEYELEKHLEDMDMFEIDFHKGANGLGISIVGSGVDTSSGEQKLSIFIKSLTPGGAAEADGRIQVYDQIVQVDGHSLVGVSQQFAAQALQSTGEIIHFVLARDKDPPNSRIAKILSEKQEEDEEDAKSNKSPDKSQEMAATQTDNVVQQLSGGDSTEALHNLIAVATRTLKQANEWDDDDEDEDIVAENEEGEDFELESSCANISSLIL